MDRKKIAVFISALYEDMVVETVQGLLSAARDENLKLVFFTSFADNHTSKRYDRYQDYDTGDFVVYLLPDLKEYDVLISFDTYMTGSFIEPINILKKAVSIPVITMGTIKEGTYSIINDQEYSFRELIEHLMQADRCKSAQHTLHDAFVFKAEKDCARCRSENEQNGRDPFIVCRYPLLQHEPDAETPHHDDWNQIVFKVYVHLTYPFLILLI